MFQKNAGKFLPESMVSHAVERGVFVILSFATA